MQIWEQRNKSIHLGLVDSEFGIAVSEVELEQKWFQLCLGRELSSAVLGARACRYLRESQVMSSLQILLAFSLKQELSKQGCVI